jgi:hypothetical protein
MAYLCGFFRCLLFGFAFFRAGNFTGFTGVFGFRAGA